MPDGATAAPTIGLDLAAQPATTAVCLLRWDVRPARVGVLETGVDDERLLALVEAEQPAKLGIDAPFGWPAAFVDAVAAYSRDGRFPAGQAGTERLRLRATDLHTRQQAGWPAPLSVSTDRIGVCAIRCARLLSALADGPVDRSGAGLAVEVYPAAALRLWGLPARRYKGSGSGNAERRHALADAFRAACAGWLSLHDSETAAIRSSDHALDALVAAVVARATLLGRTAPIPDASLAAAHAEGWIHLPESGRLQDLDLTCDLWRGAPPDSR